MSVEPLDGTNLAILSCLRTAGQPLWKTRIRECLEEDGYLEHVSVQTIGRRIDDLSSSGLVESCIISPEDLHRDLIIAYQITDTGAQRLEEARHNVFDALVGQQLSPDEKASRVNKSLLLALIQEEFDLSEQTCESLEQYSRDDLVQLLMLECMDRRRAMLSEAEVFAELPQDCTITQLVHRYVDDQVPQESSG